MSFPWHERALLALGSGVALALAFPNYDLPTLAWLSVGMLVLASVGAPPRQAPLYGFLHGLVFYPVCLPWIATVMKQYGSVDPLLSAGIVGLIGLAGGIIWSSFSYAVAVVSRRSIAMACTLAPFFWVSLEFLRTHLPYIGFPWNLTGYAVRGRLALLQLLPITGVYGLSFLIAAYSSFAAYVVLSKSKQSRRMILIITAILIIIATAGSYLVPGAIPHHVAHLVQLDFPQSEHYPANWMQIHSGELDQLEQLSVEAAKKTPGLIVWPEVPAPFTMQDPQFAARARRIARESGNEFLVGIVDWKRSAQGDWDASNSATLLKPTGQRVYTYDKVHLVPFGEYVPLRKWLTFAKHLTADISDFTPGTVYRVGQISGGKFGTFICYEAIFPGEMRRFAANGAELLINISNDGWFGRSAAPEQHLMMSRFRAIESRRWLLRDTNNGYTVSIDPYGRVVASLATDIRGQLDAPYDFRKDLTLYARFGDWFSWMCVIVTVGLVATILRNRKLEMGKYIMTIRSAKKYAARPR